MPVWKTLGQARLLVKAKTLPKTLFFLHADTSSPLVATDPMETSD